LAFIFSACSGEEKREVFNMLSFDEVKDLMKVCPEEVEDAAGVISAMDEVVEEGLKMNLTDDYFVKFETFKAPKQYSILVDIISYIKRLQIVASVNKMAS
jgi:hypothetical protein